MNSASFPIVRPAMTARRSLLAGLAMAAICLASSPAHAQSGADLTLPDGVDHVVSVEGIHEFQMANGLRVVLWPDPSQATTTVNITYLVGSLHEGYGETGMAHLLEHLLFKGSTDHPNIPDELTAHGARPNGTTWYDRTNYYETFSATEENLDWALDLESDRMVNSFIRQEDLDSEMSVVRNEFEIGENNPEAILEERVYATAYIWHNYGNTTIGARSDIESVPIERLRAFYETWYRPENAILTVAGKLDAEKTLALIHEKFASIENPPTPVPTVYTREPAQDGERSVTLRRVGEIQASMVAYHIPSGAHADYAPLQVLAHILGSEPSGRLHKSLVESGLATSVRSRADRFKDPSLFVLSVEVPKDKDLAPAQKILVDVAAELAANPPTQEEVDRARNASLRRWNQRQRNTSRAAIGLTEWASMGDWRLMFLHRDRLAAVSPEDVARVADTYFRASNRTIGQFLPTDAAERVEIEDAPDLDELLATYSGGAGLAMGEDFDPSPENIESRLERVTLANGTELLLLPKKTQGEAVRVRIALHFGDESSLNGLAQVGALAGSMLDRGTTTRTRQAIRDELDRLQATVRISGGATSASASIEVPRPQLSTALEVVGDMLKNPAFDSEEFRQLKDERKVSIEERKTSPRSQVRLAMNRHLYPREPGHVLYTMTPDEALADLEPITESDLQAFHENFYGADQGQIAIVGDFDATEVRTQVERLFEDWSANTPHTPIVDAYESRTSLIEQIQIPDKESAAMAAGLRVQMNDVDSHYPAASLGGFMLGGGFLNSRLATRIRQEEGLSYSVWGWFSAPVRGDAASFNAFAMYAPQNDERLLVAFKEEMEKAVGLPFTEEEVAEAKSGWLQRRQVSRSNDGELASLLTRLAYNDRTLEWEAELEKRVADVTSGQVTVAMQRIIDPDQISIVRAGDFTKQRDSDPTPKATGSVVN